MIDDILLEAEDKMDKAVDAAAHEFASIRTGRATSSMFEQWSVEYYGAPTPMRQLASFQIPEARTVIISPFDRTATQEILRTLRESDLGVNPTDDGNVIRVVLPALTEERRKEYKGPLPAGLFIALTRGTGKEEESVEDFAVFP